MKCNKLRISSMQIGSGKGTVAFVDDWFGRAGSMGRRAGRVLRRGLASPSSGFPPDAIMVAAR